MKKIENFLEPRGLLAFHKKVFKFKVRKSPFKE